MELMVQPIPAEDAWKDIVRIPAEFRKDDKGKHIASGTICRLSVKDRSKWVIMHGLDDKNQVIQMDFNVRLALDVEKDVTYNFRLKRIGWLRGLWFPWKASDTVYRIVGQISIISFILGALAFLLGLATLPDVIAKFR